MRLPCRAHRIAVVAQVTPYGNYRYREWDEDHMQIPCGINGMSIGGDGVADRKTGEVT
jgi:hypothetical protein